jgi:hypothetical protein
MPNIQGLKKKWYFEAKDKMDRSALWCLSFDGTCRGKRMNGVFVHDDSCSLARQVREYKKYSGEDPQSEIAFGDAQEISRI